MKEEIWREFFIRKKLNKLMLFKDKIKKKYFIRMKLNKIICYQNKNEYFLFSVTKYDIKIFQFTQANKNFSLNNI